MTPLTHEQCSELLRPFVQGELGAQESADVRSHLSGCDACRREEAGLRALIVAEPDSMNERERAHLRARVMAAIGEPEQVPSVSTMQRPSRAASIDPRTNWRARTAGAMAAAAGIVIIAGLFYLGSGGLSGRDDGAETMQGADGADGGGGQTTESLQAEAAPEEAAGDVAEVEADSEQLNSTTAGRGGSGTTSSGAEGFAEPLPAFLGADRRYEGKHLTRLGERGLQLVLFRRAYTADDAPRLQQDFVERLAASAARRAGDATGDQVRECATVVLAREETALPAFAALGRFENEEVLVLGFAWSEEPSGRMDRYMLWTWPRGSCDSPADYRSGSIRPAN